MAVPSLARACTFSWRSWFWKPLTGTEKTVFWPGKAWSQACCPPDHRLLAVVTSHGLENFKELILWFQLKSRGRQRTGRVVSLELIVPFVASHGTEARPVVVQAAQSPFVPLSPAFQAHAAPISASARLPDGAVPLFTSSVSPVRRMSSEPTMLMLQRARLANSARLRL